MPLFIKLYYLIHDGIFGLFRYLDGLAPLLFRLLLAPVLLGAGIHKWNHFEDIVFWFDKGLDLPNPELMAYLATFTEIVGGFLLLFGLAVRWVSIPLMVTMIVAITSVHWENGWFAIAPGDPETSTAKVLADIGIPAAAASLENSVEVGKRLERARRILQDHGDYDWLTAKGSFVILNNGIEFAAMYFMMLLSLFFTGGGRYTSIDYYLDRSCRRALAQAYPYE